MDLSPDAWPTCLEQRECLAALRVDTQPVVTGQYFGLGAEQPAGSDGAHAAHQADTFVREVADHGRWRPYWWQIEPARLLTPRAVPRPPVRQMTPIGVDRSVAEDDHMADTSLGLTDYAKEMARWNTPYIYQHFPLVLYLGITTTAGRIEVKTRQVQSETEEHDARAHGWCLNPQAAQDAETRRQEAIGTAAAERAYTDRQMSGPAQAEAAAADQAAGAKHLGEIRERPRRPRPSRANKKKPEVAP